MGNEFIEHPVGSLTHRRMPNGKYEFWDGFSWQKCGCGRQAARAFPNTTLLSTWAEPAGLV